jgi:hypothetical protein
VIVGFTGTREGMTPLQLEHVELLMRMATEAHHGDCVGGDEQFHTIARKLGVPVVIHPPKDSKLRAFCEGAIKIEPPLEYLARNRRIVKAVDLLIGAPKEDNEPGVGRGQGTWSCIRHARNVHTTLVVVWPNGKGGLRT